MRAPEAYYDPATDSLMIDLADGEGVEAIEVAQNVILTVDKQGRPVAVEFLSNVRELLAPVIKQQSRAPADASGMRRRAAS